MNREKDRSYALDVFKEGAPIRVIHVTAPDSVAAELEATKVLSGGDHLWYSTPVLAVVGQLVREGASA